MRSVRFQPDDEGQANQKVSSVLRLIGYADVCGLALGSTTLVSSLLSVPTGVISAWYSVALSNIYLTICRFIASTHTEQI